MQFFGNFGKIIGRHHLPGGLASPPTENPGSAPGYYLWPVTTGTGKLCKVILVVAFDFDQFDKFELTSKWKNSIFILPVLWMQTQTNSS